MLQILVNWDENLRINTNKSFAEKCNGFHSYPNIKKPELSVLDTFRRFEKK